MLKSIFKHCTKCDKKTLQGEKVLQLVNLL